MKKILIMVMVLFLLMGVASAFDMASEKVSFTVPETWEIVADEFGNYFLSPDDLPGKLPEEFYVGVMDFGEYIGLNTVTKMQIDREAKKTIAQDGGKIITYDSTQVDFKGFDTLKLESTVDYDGYIEQAEAYMVFDGNKSHLIKYFKQDGSFQNEFHQMLNSYVIKEPYQASNAEMFSQKFQERSVLKSWLKLGLFIIVLIIGGIYGLIKLIMNKSKKGSHKLDLADR